MSNFTRAERRRIEKASKNNRSRLQWAEQFDYQLRQEYDQAYKKELGESIDVFFLAVAYTLHFNEATKFGQKRLASFLEDLFVTIDLFRTGEYKPEDYAEQLKENGVIIENHYDYEKIFREKYEKYVKQKEMEGNGKMHG